jgi:hypothetical protein
MTRLGQGGSFFFPLFLAYNRVSPLGIISFSTPSHQGTKDTKRFFGEASFFPEVGSIFGSIYGL